jgi:uracil-DNA glycosylase
LVMLLLLTMAGPAPTEGTAGGAEGRPFTGDAEEELAWWLGAWAPTAAEGLLFTMVGGCFPFVAAAFAYEERALDVVPEAADGAAGEADCA